MALQYRFWVTNLTVGRTVHLELGNPGSYAVQVWVRSAGSTQAFEAWADAPTVRRRAAAGTRFALERGETLVEIV